MIPFCWFHAAVQPLILQPGTSVPAKLASNPLPALFMAVQLTTRQSGKTANPFEPLKQAVLPSRTQ